MKRVLVAEDDEDLRQMLAILLKDYGYEPILCEDGLAAWQKLLAEGADMVVSDVNMPRMNGLELVQRIRKDPRTHSLPVLMLTVRSEVDQQVEGYETGADDYLAKPFNSNVLLERLKALERRLLPT